jgi:molecular chaperone DnaJ
MAQPDFYKVLGVTETASADEIKKAYRKLAKKYHPDVTGGDKAKEAKFKEVSQAYDVLGDEKRRGEYDQERKNPFAGASAGGPGGFSGFGGFPGFGGTRTSGRRSGRGGGGGGINIDLEDLLRNSGGGGGGGFADIFGDAFGGGQTARRGADIQTSIELTLPEAALGGEKSFTLEPGSASERRLTMRIPAGVEDGENIRLSGQGRPSPGGGAPGNLLIKVSIQPHPQFRRKGADIEVDVPITVDEAVLGTSAEIPTLEGTKAKVNIPAGTSSGTKLRLRGKGAGDRKGGRGDLYGVVQIAVPKAISDEARRLIEQFAELTRGH